MGKIIVNLFVVDLLQKSGGKDFAYARFTSV